ncbi:uncharacterized protein [Fopius arisanus]|uniref:ABCA12_0 protein n=1 Tax=Fopius arisanus TaxID=64838 RepID=A0A0C9RBS4_9HYME|nr:PREDICTED: uncharacterized protein LOC105273492 isoform X1 [Fopius arisanus]XP_011314261.1 PREDICTED: uncharacterized protein LOC105273492 isoform X2 [Fopius arisanus]XP_011314262.1 PREDICTED: uncharacterized protein LOC105273492 isoform X3 [Fopius arisanus]
MANINEVINGLYEALVKVRYPGVTNIECGDLENTLLAQNDRNKLLHWLLVQSLRAISSTADEPKADDESLVKWYIQLGICDNKAALLGQCPIKDQLDTLIRLTRFVMNVLGVNGEKKVIPEEAENILDRYLNTEINLIPSSCKLTTKLGYNEAKRYMKKLSESVKEHAPPSTFASIDKTDNPQDLEGKTDQLDEQTLSASAETVEKFCAAFQDIDKWVKLPEESRDTSTELIDNYIENIHSNFSTLNETLQNKNEILKAVIPTGLDTGTYPLDQIIQDTVIGLEELQKVTDRNDN